MSEPERFECRPRGATLRIAQCFVDYRLRLGPCAGCTVGAKHAELVPAERWKDGARVRWIGDAPPELAAPREYSRRGRAAGVHLSVYAPLYSGEPITTFGSVEA